MAITACTSPTDASTVDPPTEVPVDTVPAVDTIVPVDTTTVEPVDSVPVPVDTLPVDTLPTPIDSVPTDTVPTPPVDTTTSPLTVTVQEFPNGMADNACTGGVVRLPWTQTDSTWTWPDSARKVIRYDGQLNGLKFTGIFRWSDHGGHILFTFDHSLENTWRHHRAGNEGGITEWVDECI